MRFLVNVVDDGQAAAAGRTESATRREAEAVDALNARLGDAIVVAAGISAPDDAVVVDGRSGSPQVTTGPLHRGPEYVAGFWVLELPDSDTALRVAGEASAACNRKIELRPLL